jgi:hypothetical protein
LLQLAESLPIFDRLTGHVDSTMNAARFTASHRRTGAEVVLFPPFPPANQFSPA